jgi:hypothetical protein
MFPIAHAWLINSIADNPTPAHMLGCIWPDMLFESPLNWQQAHQSGARLVAFATDPAHDTSDTFRQFVTGVLSHGSEPHGFDWYSDEQYGDRLPSDKGYAFQRALPLATEAARACGIANELGWWKAHNLIEMAFEHTLYRATPELGHALTGACASGSLIAHIAGPLAQCFGVPAEALEHAMKRFVEVATFHPATIEDLAQIYAVQVRLKHAGAEPDEAALARLIGHATDIIAADKDGYLAHCVTQVGGLVRSSGL